MNEMRRRLARIITGSFDEGHDLTILVKRIDRIRAWAELGLDGKEKTC